METPRISKTGWIKETWLIYTKTFLHCMGERSHVLCKKLDAAGDCNVKRDKPIEEAQIRFSFICDSWFLCRHRK